MGNYQRLMGESWKVWLEQIMRIHGWSITDVSRITNHPRSIIGYWLAAKRVAYGNTQNAVRTILEKQPLSKKLWRNAREDRRDLTKFLKSWEWSRGA